MRERDHKGRYGRHNTPGDGTGMSKLPESNYDAILTDAKGGDPNTINYPPSWEQARRERKD